METFKGQIPSLKIRQILKSYDLKILNEETPSKIDVLCLVEYLYFLKLLAKECEHDAQKNEEKKITKESVDSVFPKVMNRFKM
ncbi:centromere protein w [Anaeramoeba ignava]|uniref:Centromere protein w n=1 Tax=Anaeramoeba ignava TaxID=1746090 RepID=A0A9Q0LLD1_ANAIG|nr:centromere protein w [Anaeramoeba ignava]